MMKLPAHEWAIVLVIVTLVFVVVGVSLWNNREVVLKEIEGEKATIVSNKGRKILVEGAVKFPGEYDVAGDSKIGDVLTLAKPLEEADLTKLNLQTSIGRRHKIVVPYQQQITVFVEGAIENGGLLHVKRGTRVCELKDRIKLKSGADSTMFDKKRYLKDGETIKVN